MTRLTAEPRTSGQGRSPGRVARPRRRRSLVALAVLGGLVVALAGCSDASSSSEAAPGSSATTGSSSAEATVDPGWDRIDDELSALGPDVGLLAAEVASDGTCDPIHEVESSAARPTASQFKLFVLGALAEDIAAGELAWDQVVSVDDVPRSLGNGEGSLQVAPAGTSVTVEEAATKMISISDNTATDLLIEHVGRDDVEAQARAWMADSSANEPFLTTRQVFLLHYVPGLADRYLATPADERAAFLASSVDPLPIGDIAGGVTAEPSHIDTIEWFASPLDVCQAFAGLQEQSTDPELTPLSTILSQEVAGIGLDPSDWPTVWYKGGSEPGVLTLGWLAVDDEGRTFVVQAMVSDPEAALADDSITDLVALAKDAFALIE